MVEPNLTHLRELVRRSVALLRGIGRLIRLSGRRPGKGLSGLTMARKGRSATSCRSGLSRKPTRRDWRSTPIAVRFLFGENLLGIWCPEGRSLRFACFDLDTLKAFDFAEVAGWFKQSADRIYAATPPVAEFEVRLDLTAGTHKIETPAAFAGVDEVIAPTSYKAMSADDPAFALFVVYPSAGLVEVLPQKWFTGSQYQVGPQWISRAARDPETHRIAGECFGVGTFLLQEDGCRLERWL